MGNKHSTNTNCYITKDGEHVTRCEIINAGAAQSRLEDTESPCPIGDSIWSIIDANKVNWNATPDNIEGPCKEDH